MRGASLSIRARGSAMGLVRFFPLIMIAASAPAAAQQGVFSQLNLGVLGHDVPILGPQREHGVDLNGELVFVSPIPDRWVSGIAPNWRWVFKPRPAFGFEANTNGYTSQVYASLVWTVDLDNGGTLWPDHTVFLSLSFGPAYNTGHVQSRAGNRLSLGSNVLFHAGLEL